MTPLKRLFSAAWGGSWLRREHYWLMAALLVQIALVVAVFWPRAAVEAAGAPLFPGLTAEQIVEVAIRDERGESLALLRQGDGWVLADTDGFPAKEAAVQTLLEQIVTLRTDRLVTRTKTSHGPLQVAADAFVREIALRTAEGASYTLYLGSSPSYGATHFRLAGQDETYLTGGLTSWTASAAPASWVDTAYLSVPQADVRRLAVSNALGEYTLVRDAEGQWTLEDLAEGETMDSAVAASLAARATSFNLLRPLGRTEQPDYGLAAPQATVTLETATETLTLRVGSQGVDGSYIVKSSGSDYYVRVSEYAVKDLAEKGREALLKGEAE